LLRIENLRYAYSGVTAVRDVSLQVREGEIVALIGSNGAGKSTTVNVVAGVLCPLGGIIHFFEDSIGGRPAYEVVEYGITLVPEGRLIFPQMTVYENLIVGAHPKRAKSSFKENLDRAFAIFPRLEERRNQSAGSLSGGEQQMLAIARGLMSAPRLMILDEPSLGLSPLLVEHVFELISDLNQSGISILLVEQNAHLSLQIADNAYVLEKGRVVLSDRGDLLMENEFVKRAFLGL
jgi:branched-chain amino acid transport system ATP-binding protein